MKQITTRPFVLVAAVILMTAATLVTAHTAPPLVAAHHAIGGAVKSAAGDAALSLTFENESKTAPNPLSENEAATQTASLQRVPITFSFVAERGRFELPWSFHPNRFSKPAHSTALPPLRVSAKQ